MDRAPRDPKAALDLARAPHASAAELACLAASEHGFVREAVASHPAATPTVLASLVPADLERSEDRSVALALAGRADAPSSALVSLLHLLDRKLLDGSDRGNREHERIAVALCVSARCPLALAVELVRDPRVAVRVRREVAKKAVSLELIERLAEDPSGRVAAAARRRSGELVERREVDVGRETRLVRSFVRREHRERFLALLTDPKRRARALDALNHFDDLDPRYATEVPSGESAQVEARLRALGAPAHCYVVSDVRELDGSVLPLGEALARTESDCWGTLIDCVPGQLAYYYGEHGEQRLILAREPDVGS